MDVRQHPIVLVKNLVPEYVGLCQDTTHFGFVIGFHAVWINDGVSTNRAVLNLQIKRCTGVRKAYRLLRFAILTLNLLP